MTGNEAKRLRQDAGISQQTLAFKTGQSIGNVQMNEQRNAGEVSAPYAQKIQTVCKPKKKGKQ